jgi:hypothetical protein
MWYKCNGMLFCLKRKEILTYAATWMNHEDVMLSKISQSQKDKYCAMIPLIWGTQCNQNHRDRKQNGAQGAGGRNDPNNVRTYE